MSSLSETAENLSTGLAKAESDLNNLLRQFEGEFHQRFAKSYANPHAILQRIRKIERELPALQAECQALLEAKKEVVDKVSRTLTGNRELLSHLENKAGIGSSGSDATFQAFTAAVHQWDTSLGRGSAGVGDTTLKA